MRALAQLMALASIFEDESNMPYSALKAPKPLQCKSTRKDKGTTVYRVDNPHVRKDNDKYAKNRDEEE